MTKVFEIDDGERHWYIAETEAAAFETHQSVLTKTNTMSTKYLSCQITKKLASISMMEKALRREHVSNG
jgi:hypothetical protein